MTFRKAFLLVLLAVAVAIIGAQVFPANPLWKSQRDLKAWVLKQAPLGSSVEDVMGVIKKQGWELLAEWHGNPGKISSDTPYPSIKDYPGVLGEYFIQADLGSYQGVPWRVGVDAHWGFDSAGRLVDLRIRKMADAL